MTRFLQLRRFWRIGLASSGLLLLVASTSYLQVVANSGSDLRSQINQLESEIAANRAQLNHFDHEADTLAAAVADMDRDLAVINQEIQLLELKLSEIRTQLDQTRKDLEEQKGILRQALREHYTFGEVRTIELLAESDSFSDFFDQQEYLNRIRSSIQDSAKKVAELEKQLEEQETEQQRLLDEEAGKKVALEGRRAAKQRLLNETRGQEEFYRARVADLERRRQAAEAELDRYIQSLLDSGVSLGPIAKGEFVGFVGNTGYSSGPHLHFAIHQNNSPRNPITVMNQLGWAWPVPARPNTTQGYNGDHPAIDIGTQGEYGVQAVSTADGEIIHKGCLFYSDPKFNNYAVIIRHANGYSSRYIHLDPSDNPAYNACRANTYP